MEDELMCYVAADPTQPGAAWAACVDKPEYRKENAKAIADWIKRGANVQRVPHSQTGEMLMRWVRPEKAKKSNTSQSSLL